MSVILGVVGWGYIAATVHGFEDDYRKKVVDPFQDRIREYQTQIDIQDAGRKHLASQLPEFQKSVDNAEPKFLKIESFATRFDELETKFRDASGQLAATIAGVDAIKTLPDQVANLATQVEKLAKQPGSSGSEDVAKVSGAIYAGARQTVDKLSQAVSAPTVFVQYANIDPDKAKELQKRLQGYGYIVPPIESVQMPNYGLSEIRYYFDADRAAAEEVAKKTAQTVESLGIPGLRAVSVKSLVDWPKAKPKEGTLELWIGAPTAPTSPN